MAAPTEWMVNGYVQGRFTQDMGQKGASAPFTTPTDSFDVKRAYLQWHVKLDEHVGAQIMACMNWTIPPYVVDKATVKAASNPDKPEILEAYAEYINNSYQARAGLSRIPFGYEVPLSSAQLITTERSQIMQTQLYPFAFDRGLFGYYKPSKGIFNVSLAITDGQTTDNPNATTQAKNGVGRVGILIPGGTIGVSGYVGHNPAETAGTNVKFNYIGADLQDKFGNFLLIGEYLQGSNGTTHPQGGYATLAYKLGAAQPYARYDLSTPDKNAVDCYFHRGTVGVNYFLNPTSKFQVEYQTITDDLNPSWRGQVVTQYQVCF